VLAEYGEDYHRPPENLSPPPEPIFDSEQIRRFHETNYGVDATYRTSVRGSVEPVRKRGWLRVTAAQRPEVVLVKLWPFGWEISICSDHRCRETKPANYVTAIADLASFSSPTQLSSQ
jgi:hypothetical protein